MEPQINLWFTGRVYNPVAYGAPAKLALHIAAHYYPEGSSVPVNIPGTGPFTVEVKVDGVLVWTQGDIQVCNDPNDNEEYNFVNENLPAGTISLIITDSTVPEPLDCRGNSCFNTVSPPFATLNGSVNPMGAETDVMFEFGTSTDYGRSASFGKVNGFNPVLASKRLQAKKLNNNDPIEFLEPETEYHYRIIAVNEHGTAIGDDVSFVTPSYDSPPVVLTLPASEIS